LRSGKFFLDIWWRYKIFN